jgi:hypothetical protein
MNNTTNKNKKQKENLLSKTFNSKIEDSWHLSEKRKKLNKKKLLVDISKFLN